MNKKTFYISSIIILLLCNFVLLFFHVQNRNHKPNGPREIIIKKLGFDENQIKNYDVLIKKHRQDISQTDEQINKLKVDLYELIANEKSNEKEKDSMINTIADVNKEIDNINFSHFEDIRKLCKPNQIGAFDSMIKDLPKIFHMTRNRPRHR